MGRPRKPEDRPCSSCGGFEGLTFPYRRHVLAGGRVTSYRSDKCAACTLDVDSRRYVKRKKKSKPKPKEAYVGTPLDLHGIIASTRKIEAEIEKKIKAVKKAPPPEPCTDGKAHVWILEAPNGTLSDAHCPECKQTRQFINSENFSGWGSVDKARKGGFASVKGDRD